uniref:Uncharacterized protein n=1 Tax=Arundo donax TaxID=35708 RepID=A0A0A8XSE3_ARUDO
MKACTPTVDERTDCWKKLWTMKDGLYTCCRGEQRLRDAKEMKGVVHMLQRMSR